VSPRIGHIHVTVDEPGAALTHIGNGVPDDLYAEARKEFSEKELVDLTWAAAAINAWNRVSISMRAVPGSYQPKGHPA
jgi:hypothetical protein